MHNQILKIVRYMNAGPSARPSLEKSYLTPNDGRQNKAGAAARVTV